MQAVVQCNILSCFCHQKKLSRHPLANRTHADVKSFRLSEAVCLKYGLPHSDSSRYHASTLQRLTCGYRTWCFHPFTQGRKPLLKVFSGQPSRTFINIFTNIFYSLLGCIEHLYSPGGFLIRLVKPRRL